MHFTGGARHSPIVDSVARIWLLLLVLLHVTNLSQGFQLFDQNAFHDGDGIAEVLSRVRRELDEFTGSLLARQALKQDEEFHLHHGPLRHSYLFGHSSASREGLQVSEMRQDQDFVPPSEVSHWLAGESSKRGLVVGLGPSGLTICHFHPSSTKASCFQHGTPQAEPVVAALFSRRNLTSRETESILVTVQNRASIVSLRWYQIHRSSVIQVSPPWTLHHPVSQILVIQIAGNFKLVVLNRPESERSYNTADIYDFHINNGVELWLSHKLQLKQAQSIQFSQVGDQFYLSVSQGKKEVVIFEYKGKKFEIVARVPSPGVSELTAFNIGSTAFLAISGSSPRIIKMPPSERGLPKVIKFPSNANVKRWLALPVDTYRDEALVLAETDHEVEVVKWNAPAHFSVDHKPPDCILSQGKTSPGLGCLTPRGLKGAAGLLVSGSPALLLPSSSSYKSQRTPEDGDNVYSSTLFIANATLVEMPSPVEKERKILLARKAAIEALLHSQNAIFEEASERLKHVLQPGGDNVITAPWTVEHVSAKNLDVSDTLEASETKVSGRAWSNEDWDNLPSVLHGIPPRIEQTKQRFRALNENISDAVMLDDEKVTVTADQVLQGSLIIKGKTLIKSAEFENLNGVPVADLHYLSYREPTSEMVLENMTVPSLQADEVYVKKSINGRPISQFALSDRPISVQGDLRFTQPLMVTGGLKVLSNAEPVFRGADPVNQTHSGRKLEATHAMLQHSSSSSPPANTAASSPSHLHVKGTLIATKNLHVKRVNGVDLSELLSKVVLLTSGNAVHVPGVTYAKSCAMHENANVANLNSLPFPGGYVLTGSKAKGQQHQDIWGNKVFHGTLMCDQLHVSETVDGIAVEELVTLDSDQEVLGEWTIEKLQIDGNLEVDESQANYLLPNSPHSLLDGSDSVSADMKFSNLTVMNQVVLTYPSWSAELQDVVFKNEPSVIVTGDKHFSGSVKVKGNLDLLGSLNQVNVSDYITIDGEQVFQDLKTIKGKVEIKNLDVGGLCLGVDISALARDAVKLSDAQSCSSQLTFLQPISITGSALRAGNVNGIADDDILTLGSAQTIHGAIKVDNLKAGIVRVGGNVKTDHALSGWDLNELEEQRLSRTKDQVVRGDWSLQFADIKGNIDIDEINEIPLKHLDSSMLAIRLKFHKGVHIDEFHVSGNIKTKSLNGYNLTALANDAIWLKGDNVISGNLIFKDELFAEKLTIHNRLNGINFNYLVNDIVTKDDNSVAFKGYKTFASGLHIYEIETEFVNSRKITNALTKYGDQNVLGPIMFNGKVTFTGGINAKYLNEYPISSWERSYSYYNNEHVIYGNLRFEESFEAKKIDVEGYIGDHSFEEFLEGVVWFSDDVLITGKKTFTNKVSMEGNLGVSKTFNGIDLSQFSKDVILLTRPTTVQGHVIFKEDVTTKKNLMLSGNLEAEWINGCNLKEWQDDAVYLDETSPVLGKKIFEKISSRGSIHITSLNGKMIDRMIFLHQYQFIQKYLTFPRITVSGDVWIGERVNDVRLDEEWQNTLMIVDNQVITGEKTFEGDIKVRGDLVTKEKVNGFDMENIVTLDSDQTIMGPIRMRSVSTQADVRVLGLLSGVDLATWKDSVVLRDVPDKTVSGWWDVRGNVSFMGSVYGSAYTLLDGVNMPSLAAIQQSRQEHADIIKEDTAQDKEIFCRDIHDLLGVANSQAFLYRYLEGTQHLPLSHQISSYAHFQLQGHHMLAVSYADKCEGVLLQWNADRRQFYQVLDFSPGVVDSWATLPPTESGDALLVSAGINPNCGFSGGNLWLVQHKNPIKFMHLQHMGNWTQVQSSKWVPDLIYSIDSNGILAEWKYADEHSGVVKVRNWKGTVSGHVEFVPLGGKSKLGLGLAVLGQQSKMVDMEVDTKGVGIPKALPIQGNFLHSFSIEPRSTGPQFTAATSHQNSRIKGRHDDIRIYEGNLENGKVFHRLPATSPGLVQSIHFGSHSENMLVYVEDGTTLQLQKYNGLAGFTSAGSLRLPGSRLLGVEHLPVKDSFAPRVFLLLATHSPGIYAIEMKMLGDPVENKFLPQECN